MPRYTRIAAARTINTGKFESTRVELEAEVAHDEDLQAAWRALWDQLDGLATTLDAQGAIDEDSPFFPPLRLWRYRPAPAAPRRDPGLDL